MRYQKGVGGVKLRNLRFIRGYTAKQLGVSSGVSFRTIQNLECRSSDINSLNLYSLCKLALSLDCRIEDLIEDDLRDLYLLTQRNESQEKALEELNKHVYILKR